MNDKKIKIFLEMQDKFSKTFDKFEKQSSRVSRKTMPRLKKGLKIAGKAFAGLSIAAGTAVFAMGGYALKAASDFQTMEVALATSFQGNEKAAKKAQDQIVDFTSRTPYQLSEVMDGFIKLKNMGLDPSERALTAYGDTASSMGKSLNQMIEAVADASTGEFERLKEFGVRSSVEGDRVKFTFQGVTTEVGNNSEEIQEYLMRLGETKFAGGMDRQSKTLAGRFSTLKDTFTLTMVSIANDSGLLDIATQAVKELTDFLINNEDDILSFSQSVANLAKDGFDLARDSVIKAQAVFESIISNYEEHKELYNTLAILLESVAAAFILLQGALLTYAAVMAIGSAVTTAFGIAMAIATSPITLIVLAIAAVIAISILLWKNWDTVTRAFADASNWVTGQVQDAWDSMSSFVMDNLTLIMTMIFGPFGGAITWLIQNWDMVKSATGATWDWVKNKIFDVVDSIKNKFQEFKSLGSSIGKGIANGIVDSINGAIGGLNNLADKANGLPGVNIGSFEPLERYAKGGNFITNGPQAIVVGDNPGGKEKVEITPLSSPNYNGPQNTSQYNNVNIKQDINAGGELASMLEQAIQQVTESVVKGYLEREARNNKNGFNTNY